MRQCRLQDAAAQPWRNGGGITHELLAWPVVDSWLLRVSVATIDRSGPFSAFPDVDRWFTVLEGPGVKLDLPEGEFTLRPGSAPAHFQGEAAPTCHLLGGATRDLNLMARRSAGRSDMSVAESGSELAGNWRWRGLYAADALTLDIHGVTHRLQAGTLAWSDAAEPALWRRDTSPAAAWWLTLAI